MLQHRPSHVIPGGTVALVLFVVSLVSFTAQSQLAQYLQTTLEYQKSYFILYCAHSSFLLLLPLHLAFLYVWPGETVPIRLILRELKFQVRHQLDGTSASTELAAKRVGWPWAKAAISSIGLTAGMTIPAGCWYASVPLTSMTSITTIYNTSALFAYAFSVLFLAVPLELKKVTAVGVATVGVALVAYGGAASPDGQEEDERSKDRKLGASFLGDLLALGGAASYGLYEVLYKRYCSLPDPPPSLSSRPRTVGLPFALHANLLTSVIGLTTLTVLAIPLYVFDALGWEPFELPSDWITSLTLVGIVLGGIGFNGSFMILLGLWGPIVGTSERPQPSVLPVFSACVSIG
ncbi:Predicted membrane protein [Phaffia rhodozyma]|uniref:Predicted membrane protein n=1 Tax=Phaffia rhodozyma TaxID=264483 RepID=A0A0F7SQ78_PHARH|nr:Predicted membrane protein [Phaffia rhodozyma]